MKKILIIFVALMLPVTASALIAVGVDVGNQSVNAIEGMVVLPAGITPSDIRIGHSAILVWVAKPVFDEKTHAISFAGFSPGGFSGRQTIFEIEISDDSAIISAGGSLQAYKNDGIGTSFEIAYGFAPAVPEEDREAPEPFVITRSASPDLFGGRDFIAFDTQDKNTGIDRFEYSSAWWGSPSSGSWREIESPIALSTSDLFKKMYVRAVDKAGNARTVSTVGPYRAFTLIFGLIMLLCIAQGVRRFFSSAS